MRFDDWLLLFFCCYGITAGDNPGENDKVVTFGGLTVTFFNEAVTFSDEVN